MIVVDANVLLYAYHPRSEKHPACRAWVEETFSGPTPVGLPWVTTWAFLRIATNPRAFEQPLTMQEAAAIVSSWLDQPVVRRMEPGERYWEILTRLLLDAQITGPLVTDAAIAALAIENGATVCTTDLDFARFPQIRTVDPTRA